MRGRNKLQVLCAQYFLLVRILPADFGSDYWIPHCGVRNAGDTALTIVKLRVYMSGYLRAEMSDVTRLQICVVGFLPPILIKMEK